MKEIFLEKLKTLIERIETLDGECELVGVMIEFPLPPGTKGGNYREIWDGEKFNLEK